MSISTRVALAVFRRDDYKCVACDTTENLTVDHIWPRRHGGRDETENLQTLCQRCNSAKGDRTQGLTPPAYVDWQPLVLPPSPDPGSAHGHVGASELATLLGVSRQRVQQLGHEPSFPEPIYRAEKATIWHTADVVAWAQRTGRTVTD